MNYIDIAMCSSFNFLRITSGLFGCGKVIKGFQQLHVRIMNDECSWLDGDLFFSKFNI
jgi:hypothetical protein